MLKAIGLVSLKDVIMTYKIHDVIKALIKFNIRLGKQVEVRTLKNNNNNFIQAISI